MCESVNCGTNLLLSSHLCHWQLCELEQVIDLLMPQFTHLENGDKIEQTSSGCQEDETSLCKVLGAYPWHIGSLSKGLLSLLVQTSFLQAVYNFFPHLNIRRMIQNFLLSLDQNKTKQNKIGHMVAVAIALLTPGPASPIQVDFHPCSPGWVTVLQCQEPLWSRTCADGGTQDRAFLFSPHLLKLRMCFLISKNVKVKTEVKLFEDVLFFFFYFMLLELIAFQLSSPLAPSCGHSFMCTLYVFSENYPNCK